MGQRFRASIYMEARIKIEEENGLLNTIKAKSHKHILSYKFMAKDSSKLKSMLLEKNISTSKRQKVWEKVFF